ncbi:hypothetical protein [Streptomyces abikoensis]
MEFNTLTESEVAELGEAVGDIIACAAHALHATHGHDIDALLRTFTRPACTNAVAVNYLHALEQGRRNGAAAADAAVMLIRAWADARLETKALLDARRRTKKDIPGGAGA